MTNLMQSKPNAYMSHQGTHIFSFSINRHLLIWLETCLCHNKGNQCSKRIFEGHSCLDEWHFMNYFVWDVALKEKMELANIGNRNAAKMSLLRLENFLHCYKAFKFTNKRQNYKTGIKIYSVEAFHGKITNIL